MSTFLSVETIQTKLSKINIITIILCKSLFHRCFGDITINRGSLFEFRDMTSVIHLRKIILLFIVIFERKLTMSQEETAAPLFNGMAFYLSFVYQRYSWLLYFV
jgi:hypothetical protein